MKYEKYESLIASSDYLEYEFTSIGPKGNIQKSIKYQPTTNAEIYNLAFGNLNTDGTIDDETEKEMIAYAKSLGINLKIDPNLHKKYEGKGTTSNKLEKANEVISNLKLIHK